MAVFGVQLAFSVILASFISKFGGKYSLGTWLLCNTGLIRYLHPTDQELRDLAEIKKDILSKGKGKGKSSNQDLKNPNSCYVHWIYYLNGLDSVKVSAIEVKHLRFYSEYHWLVDFTMYSTIIYVMTEIYYGIMNPTNEMNLSIFWCILSLFLSLKVLCSITAVYFRGDKVIGKQSIFLVMMGMVYLLVAMIALIVDESSFEAGIDPVYRSFYENDLAFLKNQRLESNEPASKLIVKFVIAVCCSFFGSLFTFPGIQMSKMYQDSLRYCEGKLFLKFLIKLSYILPFLITSLWIGPIGWGIFTQTPIGCTGEPLMTDDAFDSMRLILVVLFVVLRVILMPWYLQSFLNVAQDKLNDQMKEAGRILNTNVQKKVGAVYYNLCIVALQYIVPCLVVLQCCFMYKTLGGGSWFGGWTLTSNDSRIDETPFKQVFGQTLFKGIWGLALWFTMFLQVVTSMVGSMYSSFLSSG